MNKREQLAEVFRDTQAFYQDDPILAEAVTHSCKSTKLYAAEDYPAIPPRPERVGAIRVSKKRSFQAAMDLHQRYPGKRIAVLNFASASTPGGGVKNGSSAQEEGLCRCSTLYPTLNRQWLWEKFYHVNRDAHDPLHTDACIYSPGVVICKTDEDFPVRLLPEQFVAVDVISCAAPNLRGPRSGNPIKVSGEELYQLHRSRAKHILHIAASNGAELLVLGAFGCGVFANSPDVVAHAWFDALKDYQRRFELIEFAVYCNGEDTRNYDTFKAWKHLSADDVTVIEAGGASRDEYGEAYGSQWVQLTADQLASLNRGKQLAFNIMSGEYVLFLEGPAAKD